MPFTCDLAAVCSGCEWIGRAYDTQLSAKRDALRARLAAASLAAPDVEMRSAGEGGLRDRVDFTWRRDDAGRLAFGLFDTTRSRIVDLARCPQLTPELESWLEMFRTLAPPGLERGSARLRVSPSGDRGVWLDLANVDVRALLDEEAWLERLLELGTVEIGQRFKPLVRTGARLRLGGEAEPQPWFETYVGNAFEAAPLFGVVGSFTQPGFKANRALVEAFAAHLPDGERALELFSGLGNFTLPLASRGFDVTAFEVDAVSVASLEATLARRPALAKSVHPAQKNLYSKRELPELKGFDLVVVDPPRSGLRDVLDLFERTPAAERPPSIVYVSCFAESFTDDLALLATLGYRVAKLTGVDQFPQTPHCEWIATLSL